MKILLLGWYYDQNLGDAVICDCAAALLRQAYPQAEIVVLDMAGQRAFPPHRPFDTAGFRAMRRRHRIRVLATRLGWDKMFLHEQGFFEWHREAVAKIGKMPCDLVVFAGGQLFMDSLAPYVDALTSAFATRGIPVIFNACGVGPSWSRKLRGELCHALTLPNVRHISCRDDCARVNAWCGRELAVPTADPALWADTVYGIRRDEHAQMLGLGVMDALTMPRGAAFRFWRRLIPALKKAGRPFRLFTNGSAGDDAFAREILASLNLSPVEYLCPPPLTPRELVRTIASFRSLVSFRLHSHILALSLGIPSVALVWDKKIPGFFEKIGCPERCLPISAGPKQVLAALEQAESSGCPPMDTLREDAKTMLYRAVDEAIAHPKGTL